MSLHTASPHSWWRLASPFLGLGAGLVAFAGLAVPDAHAAAPNLGVSQEMLTLAQGFALELSGAGSACIEGIQGLIGAFGLLDPRHATGPDAGECTQVRGLGFAFMGLMALVVIALGRMRLQTEQRRLEVVRRIVEQGHTPPRSLLEGPARRDRKRGIVLLFLGAGLMAAGFVLGDRGLAGGGLVPAFIGLGYLVSYRLALGSDEEPAS